MLQEPGSTVKHVNWYWPDCLVGDGQPKDINDVRGVYNVSAKARRRPLRGECGSGTRNANVSPDLHPSELPP